MSRITPTEIKALRNNEIFVFGSNLAGRHGKGAALLAVRFGAEYGVGHGMTGQCYAIPTKQANMKTIKLDKIREYVHTFIDFASKNPKLRFLVTAIGCGLAGYQVKEIAPIFFEKKIPKNVSLPESFWRYEITCQ